MLTRNRMRDMCTSGSVGDLGGQPPRSTRPVVRVEGVVIALADDADGMAIVREDRVVRI
jgi:hypothetical protein